MGAVLPWSDRGTVPPRLGPRADGQYAYTCPLCQREVRHVYTADSNRDVVLVTDPKGGYYVHEGRVRSFGEAVFPADGVPERYALHRGGGLCRGDAA